MIGYKLSPGPRTEMDAEAKVTYAEIDMASAETKTNQSQFKARPGMLLLFVVVVALAIYEKTGIAAAFTSVPEPAKRAILFLAAISAVSGWFLLWKEHSANGSKRKWLAIAGAALLTISIADYVLYTVVPVKYILAFHLLSSVTGFLFRWQGALAALGLIGPFFARSGTSCARNGWHAYGTSMERYVGAFRGNLVTRPTPDEMT